MAENKGKARVQPKGQVRAGTDNTLGISYTNWIKILNPTEHGRADGANNIPSLDATYCEFRRKVTEMAETAIGGQRRVYFEQVSKAKSRIAEIDATPEVTRFLQLSETKDRGLERYINRPYNFVLTGAIASLLAIALIAIAWQKGALTVSDVLISVVVSIMLAVVGYLTAFGARTSALPKLLLIAAASAATLVALIGVWFVTSELPIGRTLASGLALMSAFFAAMVGWMSHDPDPEYDRLYMKVSLLIGEKARLVEGLLTEAVLHYERAKKVENIASQIFSEYCIANMRTRGADGPKPKLFEETLPITTIDPSDFGLNEDRRSLLFTTNNQ